jgi:hypothetical protein
MSPRDWQDHEAEIVVDSAREDFKFIVSIVVVECVNAQPIVYCSTEQICSRKQWQFVDSDIHVTAALEITERVLSNFGIWPVQVNTRIREKSNTDHWVLDLSVSFTVGISPDDHHDY